MELIYEITKEDYLQFYRYQVNYSKVHKKYYNLLKYWIPSFFAVMIFFIGVGLLKQSKLFWAFNSLLFLFIWIHGFPKTYKNISRNNALKVLNDGDNSLMLGKRKMIIKEDEIEVRTEGTTSTIAKRAIKDVLIYEDMILVYLSEREAFIVPTRYLTSNEQERFTEKIKVNADVKSDNPGERKGIQGNKKRLFLGLVGFALISSKGYQMIRNNERVESVVDGEKILLPKDMAPEDLPQEKVFQDEHTRSFLQSTEETRPGFYPFLSATGAYEMDLYKDSKIAEGKAEWWISLWVEQDKYEFITVYRGGPEHELDHRFKVEYTGDSTKEQLEETIHRKYKHKYPTIEDANLNNLFERVEQKNQTIYIGESLPNEENEKDEEDENEFQAYYYRAYIFNNTKPGGITVLYTSYFYEKCEEKRQKDKEAIYDWILNSIRFVD